MTAVPSSSAASHGQAEPKTSSLIVGPQVGVQQQIGKRADQRRGRPKPRERCGDPLPPTPSRKGRGRFRTEASPSPLAGGGWGERAATSSPDLVATESKA